MAKHLKKKLAIIMRGVPGSGKSTLAKKLAGRFGVIHSTDNYFNERGIYNFDPIKLKEYHAQNLRAFRKSLKGGIPIVICDNTNIKKKEYEPYVQAAIENGYEVKIVNMPHPDPEVAAKRNIHKVPAESIQKMIDNFEE